MKVVIKRFELYPKNEPSGYAVGFEVTVNNGRSFYRDTVIHFEENESRSDEEIVSAAYLKLEEGIESEVNRLETLSPLLGVVFRSSGGVVEEEPELEEGDHEEEEDELEPEIEEDPEEEESEVGE